MDTESSQTERTEPELAGFSPLHHFAEPSTRMDLTAVKPHACMENIKQIGNYIHCVNGNHGMRLAADEILKKDEDGKFTIEKVNVITPAPPLQTKKGRAKL